eukprot:CAMPEP_0170615164 /NCGR_PEP_ID=MMETSP0224-20130122/25189_1 /TAXON_ID=285029 /ORGANISM="Togula jolla, Strain CCCM 725" /LENGTH=317 /DNA_ID=CAMNT_0010940873 /DNA_START=48 /DNA_END=1001 /DNA_ORIENTATION=-
MAQGALAFVASACCGVFAFVMLFSWASLSGIEMALRYNHVLRTVDPLVLDTPGLKFVGPFSTLIRYPKTLQTMAYSREDRDLLDGRTKDGLPLVLGVTFQYQLQSKGLYHLYRRYERNIGDYVNLFRLVGIHIVTEAATNYTAYEFFNEKQKIALKMQAKLNEYFKTHLFADVNSLQINEDDLPEAFDSTIKLAASTKQKRIQMEQQREAKKVEFATAIIVAAAQANVTVQNATGQVHQIFAQGRADAAIISTYVDAEVQAYGAVKEALGSSPGEILDFIWYDSLGGGGVGSNTAQGKGVNMLVGVNPSAYISENKG